MDRVLLGIGASFRVSINGRTLVYDSGKSDSLRASVADVGSVIPCSLRVIPSVGELRGWNIDIPVPWNESVAVVELRYGQCYRRLRSEY